MKQHFHNSTLWYAVILIIIDVMFFGFTDPTSITSPLLLVGFSLVVLSIFAIVRSIRLLAARWRGGLKRRSGADIYIAGVLCISLALSSLGQLSTRDFALLTIAAAALYWYLGYQKRGQSQAS